MSGKPEHFVERVTSSPSPEEEELLLESLERIRTSIQHVQEVASNGEVVPSSDSDSGGDESEEEVSGPGCKHYTRRCKLKAVCCSKIYWCRICHDEDNTHEMNRHAVQELQCAEADCDTLQSVSNTCVSCACVFGEYFCAVCRLFDKDKGQFHCDKCGICRVGPKTDFFHCDICNACLSLKLQGNHKCVENVSQSVCPICQEYLHTSREMMHIPKCGHMIHSSCLSRCYSQGLYQCPMCKESLCDMSHVWRQMDAACASVVLPEDLQHVRLDILCQDCHKEDKVPFNTEGLKCPHCGSYNTTQA